jgi:hypothetical protein
MLHLIQNFKFQSFFLISSFIGHEEGVNIVEEYDKQSLYPMLLKRYHYLHPMTKFKSLMCTSNIK